MKGQSGHSSEPAKIEAELHRYRNHYEFSPVGLATLDRSGMFREANPAMAALLGLDLARLCNLRLAGLITKASRPALDLFFDRVFSADDRATGEVHVPDGHGGGRHLYLEGVAFAEGSGRNLCRVAAMDVTESRQSCLELEHYRSHLEELVHEHTSRLEVANRQLMEQTENLASVYKALDSIGLIVCDLEQQTGRINTFSAGAEKLFGFRQEEALGQSIELIYPTEQRCNVADLVRGLCGGQAFESFDLTLFRKSGECFPAVVSVRPFAHRDGRFTKAVGVFRDISELIRIQAELRAVNDQLERRVEERTLELQETQKQYLHAEKLAAIGKLSASIAHEFNNPLQAIFSILKGLQKRAILEEEDRQLLEAAIAEGDRIKELIRNLQEFNRPSSGRKVVMDVHQALNSILLLHKSDFRGKRISVVLDYAEHLPRILAVPDQIKQVFLNLLTNAADACQQAGGVITIRTRHEGDRVAVAIEDTGVGIRAEEMELIFQPFYTTKPEVKGTGLGLSVSYGIVARHQGEMQVASQPNQGATFTVLLPVKGADEVVTHG
ncbi:PAS domain-containing sensor histidine kinase [Desulfobulbus alkaliphilus]|uniref:PAS domain-containing sensor histidine kinase n=1 Tax=Desulfobulbus alkaliphilus TaxID=869814 RepID=UPI0019660510|nr:PAS domain-containing sensor histidine kinase [Desulfobulbus alkaliphilus]MBM9537664.1 PAS domain S-box protein [Desulfobulbus alkaliphilus]